MNSNATNTMPVEPLKRYVLRHFDDNESAEDFMNQMAMSYRPISISATNQYVTVLVERRDA